jgi:uncharacterized membrane protein
MFITDIMAAACSAVTFVYTFIHINFVLRLPSRIMDTSLPASERNAKLIVFIAMLIIMIIVTGKFVSSVGKVVFKLAYFNKKAKARDFKEPLGLFTKLCLLSSEKVFRKISVAANGAAVFCVLSMFVLVFPFRQYERQEGRRIVMVNAYEHSVWEMHWFFPMLRMFILLFIIGLAISVLRLKIVNVKKEYDDIYALSKIRKVVNIKCRACGFDNHLSSINCGSCGEALRADVVPKATG